MSFISNCEILKLNQPSQVDTIFSFSIFNIQYLSMKLYEPKYWIILIIFTFDKHSFNRINEGFTHESQEHGGNTHIEFRRKLISIRLYMKRLVFHR